MAALLTVTYGFGVIFWITWSITNAIIAEEKGRSFVRICLVSLIFSPFIGYVYILAVPFQRKELR